MNTTSDSELLLNLLAVEIFDLAPNFDIDGEIHIDVDNIFDAVSRLNEQTKGSFACVALLSEFGLLAFRMLMASGHSSSVVERLMERKSGLLLQNL